MTNATRDRLHLSLLNAGHFMDHFAVLVFATVAALALTKEWGLTYAELVGYATPGFVAFGLFSWPAGWLADRWSREGMMSVFFFGLGATLISVSFVQTPLAMSFGLAALGMFAAIYHPVGLALLVQGREKTGMTIAVNGVWGNLGVGAAALVTGFFIDHGGWRFAFIAPGALSIALGLAYVALMRGAIARRAPATARGAQPAPPTPKTSVDARALLWRVSSIVFFTAAVSSLVFQSVTFALPKILDERLAQISVSATMVGWLTFLVFAVASVAQLVTGALLDRLGARTVFMGAASLQILFFALMPGLAGWPALAVAFGFMFGAFGQVPINDYLIGRMAKSEWRAQIYGARYVLSFSVMSAALPFIGWVHAGWGFDRLFQVLAVCAVAIMIAASLLPRRLPDAAPAPAPQPQAAGA